MKWIRAFLCAIPFFSPETCGSGDETPSKKPRWYRPKNDKSGTPIDAYHPDIPDAIETERTETPHLKPSKSQYLPKSIYTANFHEREQEAAHFAEQERVDRSERSERSERLERPPTRNPNRFSLLPPPLPIAQPDRPPQHTRHSPSNSRANNPMQRHSNEYERQNYEWKYTALLIDRLFDHLIARERDDATCNLIIQEKNHLLRLVRPQ
ncbi:MAG: hypothetical protein EOP45_13135 [Sphingobacteriaceae bacterium]|nr:MAG: hypothetical protein EOP45_13135 [Sphingobacteriaceae bacterium]